MAQDFISTGGIDYARELLEKFLGTPEGGGHHQPPHQLAAGAALRLHPPHRPGAPAELHPAGAPPDHRADPGLPGAAEGLGHPGQPAARDPVATWPSASRPWTAPRPRSCARWSGCWRRSSPPCPREDYTAAGGVESIVEILNLVDRSTEKTHHRAPGGGRPGAGRGDQEAHVRVRGHRAAGRPGHPEGAARGGHRGAGQGPEERGLGGAGQDLPQHVQAGLDAAEGRHGLHGSRPPEGRGGGAAEASCPSSASSRSRARSWSPAPAKTSWWCREPQVAKNVFKPQEILYQSRKVFIEPPHRGGGARRGAGGRGARREYTGPTAEDLRREADAFQGPLGGGEGAPARRAQAEADRIREGGRAGRLRRGEAQEQPGPEDPPGSGGRGQADPGGGPAEGRASWRRTSSGRVDADRERRPTRRAPRKGGSRATRRAGPRSSA